MISGIPALSGLPTVPSASSPAGHVATSGGGAGAAESAAPAGGGDFAHAVGDVLNTLSQVQGNATRLEAQAAAGHGSLVNTMIAASQASLDTQVTTSLLNKGLAAYTSVANMTL